MALLAFQDSHMSPPKLLSLLFRSYIGGMSMQALLLGCLLVCCPALAQDDKPQFTDVTVDVKVDFQNYSPLTPERHLHLFMGSGLAWIDHDRDDWPDLYFCQGAAFPTVKTEQPEHSDQLFRNRNGVFENITALAGLWNFDYSMGAAVGDYDNDGFQDLYVSSYALIISTRITATERGRKLRISRYSTTNDLERAAPGLMWMPTAIWISTSPIICNYHLMIIRYAATKKAAKDIRAAVTLAFKSTSTTFFICFDSSTRQTSSPRSLI